MVRIEIFPSCFSCDHSCFNVDDNVEIIGSIYALFEVKEIPRQFISCSHSDVCKHVDDEEPIDLKGKMNE